MKKKIEKKEIEVAKREQAIAIKQAIADTKEEYQLKIDTMQKEHSKQISQLLAQNDSKTTKSSK